jgi:PAS domain S-box-containing protein
MPDSETLNGWWDMVKFPYILIAVVMIGGFLITRWTFRREHAKEIERSHASQKLRESEDQFRKLFEQNTAIMLMIDPDTGNIIEANKAAADFYGWSIGGLKQMHIQQINSLPPEEVKSEMEKTLSSGSKRLEFRHRRAEGSIREVEVFSSKIEIKGKALLHSIIHDVTERKLAQAALKEHMQTMQSIIDTTPDFLVLKDRDGVYREVNAAFCHFLGKQREDIIGKTDMDLFPPDEAAAYRAVDEEIIRTGQRHSVDRQVTGARKCSWLNVTKTPFTDTTGNCIGVLNSVTDISGRKQLEAEKAIYEDQYRQLQKAESLNRMAGAVAHHFNNQLQIIMGNLEMAIDDQPQGSGALQTLTEALKATRKAADVSGLMLTYRGQAPGKQMPLDLSAVCRQNLPILQATAPKGLVLNAGIFLPASTVDVNCQPEKMVPAQKFEGSETVLLIEDEEQVRNMARIMLARLGYEVLEARDGVDAVEIFLKHQDQIRCVLSDLTMPGMNGWQTLAALRKISPDIPVILSSGYDEAQVMEDEHTEQPNAFLGKPYRSKDLAETISGVLAKGDARTSIVELVEEVSSLPSF